MKLLSSLSNCLHKLPLSVFSAGLLLLPLASASADGTKTLKGTFHSSDGTFGTFVDTITVSGATTTDKKVLKRKSDGETKTETTVTTKTSDTTKTVAYTSQDYGATATYTSNKTLTKVKGGEVGAGTYTDANGVTGAIKTLDTTAGGADISAAQSTSSSDAVSSDLHTEETGPFVGVIKDISVAPDGTVTATVTTFTILSDK